jgi:serine/threonine protein kinase
VFKATAADGRAVALKVLRPELTVTVTAERFLREIQIVQRLEHPRIGRLIDFGQSDWLLYYAMPFIEGLSLKQALDKYRRLIPADTVRIARELLGALAHAHSRRIVHRDVKPDNILIGPEGTVLVDFGIARAIQLSGTDQLTQSGMAVGTSRYMSPEQITASGELDPRADLYSLSCVLFECLAGRPPYEHPNELAVLELHRTAPSPIIGMIVPGIPDGLATAIYRGLAKELDHRWESAEAMALAVGEG